MEPFVFALIVVIGLLGLLGLLILVIYLFGRSTRRIRQRRSCWPFKYGGFGDDNGYKDWRRK